MESKEASTDVLRTLVSTLLSGSESDALVPLGEASRRLGISESHLWHMLVGTPPPRSLPIPLDVVRRGKRNYVWESDLSKFIGSLKTRKARKA